VAAAVSNNAFEVAGVLTCKIARCASATATY
jgi:hypothetical protein